MISLILLISYIILWHLLITSHLAGEEGDIDAAQLLMAKVEKLQKEKDEIVVRTTTSLMLFVTPFLQIRL